MAFVETTYSALTGSAGLFRFKEDSKATGASVVLSSDGTTRNDVGDQITTNTTGAGGINNANVHFVIRRAGAPDWLFVRGLDETLWSIYHSISGAFSGGNATTRPTAGDELNVLFSGAVSLFVGGTQNMEIQIEDATPFRWAFRTAYDYYVSFIGSLTRPILMTSFAYQGGIFGSASDPDAWLDIESMLAATSGGGGGPSDTTDPTISTFTPAPGAITRAATIAVDIEDETALEHVGISAELADGTVLQVYDGSAFVGPFAAGSTLVGDTFTIEHDAPGWPSTTVDIHVIAVDTAGNSASSTGSFTISDAPAAPTIGPFSPSDGGNTTRTGTVTIDVTDDEGRTALAIVTIDVVLADGTSLTAYNNSGFPGALAAGSSRSNITNGYRYTLVHASPGWASSTLAYRITAVDTQGRITTHTSYNLVVTDPPAAADVTLPTVTIVSPTPPGPMGRNEAVRVRVTDAGTLKRVKLYVTMGNEQYVVHNGYSFRPAYIQGSTMTEITNGFEYVLLRSGGWLAAPTFEVWALDIAGNER